MKLLKSEKFIIYATLFLILLVTADELGIFEGLKQ